MHIGRKFSIAAKPSTCIKTWKATKKSFTLEQVAKIKNKKNKKERMKEIPQTDPDLQHRARAHRHREVKNNQVTHRLDSGVQIIYSAHWLLNKLLYFNWKNIPPTWSLKKMSDYNKTLRLRSRPFISRTHLITEVDPKCFKDKDIKQKAQFQNIRKLKGVFLCAL